MGKTQRNRRRRQSHGPQKKRDKRANFTQRAALSKKQLALCPIGLKPFEENLDKTAKINKFQKRAFVHELLSRFSPSSITPRGDFYSYINYIWLRNVSVEKQQKYIVQVDDFRLAQDRVYHELDELILSYIRNHKSSRLATNLHNYYQSVIRMNTATYSRQLAREAVEQVDTWIREDNPWALLAAINSDEMLAPYAPLVWSVVPDDREPTVFRCYVGGHQFAILDINVYYDDGTETAYKAKYRRKFDQMVNSVFTALLGRDHAFSPGDVFAAEREMFDAMGCQTITRHAEADYNRVSAADAKDLYHFDWAEFSRYLGFKTPPSFFITNSLNTLRCVSDLVLSKWKTPEWRTYWCWVYLQRLTRITHKMENINYEFFGRFERGQQELNESSAVSASLYMSIPFNQFLTDQYVAAYENPATMQFTRTLCEDLKIVFQRILERNTWLASSTRAYALKKLEHFRFIYGKPEQIRADPTLEYTTVLYDNMHKIHSWRHRRFVELEGEPTIDLPMMDWTQYPVKMVGTQAYIVNASYTPSKNAIYINLGYIQKPFVDLGARGIEYNLAHLGFTIGHEMSHGFDDWGSQYGYDGALHDWWTPADKRKYKAIQADVVRQYEEYAARDGIDFDASIGIGEDLADISGLAICDEYLRDFQEKNADLTPIRYYSYEVFYTYYAFQQRQFVSKKALSAQLKTNPHPLDKYRCNVPLSRSEIFRAIYNVKRGDGMWWHNTNTIW